MQQFLNGMYYALLEGRFLFDFVHEDRMEPERLSKYYALILPNVAMLSDAQCEQLRAYVKAGGSLLATFETSLYDQDNKPRTNFGLADIFDIQKTGDVISTVGRATPTTPASSARIRSSVASQIQTGCRARSIVSPSRPSMILFLQLCRDSSLIRRSWPILPLPTQISPP